MIVRYVKRQNVTETSFDNTKETDQNVVKLQFTHMWLLGGKAVYSFDWPNTRRFAIDLCLALYVKLKVHQNIFNVLKVLMVWCGQIVSNSIPFLLWSCRSSLPHECYVMKCQS